jgi:c-di-GMP-binding flagellar brake protein YcgR
MASRQPARTQKDRAKTKKTQKPFRVYHHKRRRYVRLDVDSPIKFKLFDPYKPDPSMDEKSLCDGRILNISGGGVLMETDFSVKEGDYIMMEFTLCKTETLSGIIGKVKRVDDEDKNEKPLVGAEFMSADQLRDELPEDTLESLGDAAFSFDEQIRKMLLKHVFANKVKVAK